jgi:hypothetical protein
MHPQYIVHLPECRLHGCPGGFVRCAGLRGCAAREYQLRQLHRGIAQQLLHDAAEPIHGHLPVAGACYKSHSLRGGATGLAGQSRLGHTIRLDTNYYAYRRMDWQPPGLFTGSRSISALPMSTARSSMCIRRPQMTDSQGNLSFHDRYAPIARLAGGYYGAFTYHTDNPYRAHSARSLTRQDARARGLARQCCAGWTGADVGAYQSQLDGSLTFEYARRQYQWPASHAAL